MPISQSEGTYEYMIDTQEVELTSVDDRDCHKNTRSTSDCTREVSGDGEEAKDGTAEGCCSGDDALEFLVHRGFTMTSHDLHNMVSHNDIKERGGGLPSVDPSIAWQRPAGLSQKPQSKSSRKGRRRRA